MVIMTLLALWFAMPKAWNASGPNILDGSYLAFHQIFLWSLVGSLIWLASGKRVDVFCFMLCTLTLFWAPLLAYLLEVSLFRTAYTARFGRLIGVIELYAHFYWRIWNWESYVLADIWAAFRERIGVRSL